MDFFFVDGSMVSIPGRTFWYTLTEERWNKESDVDMQELNLIPRADRNNNIADDFKLRKNEDGLRHRKSEIWLLDVLKVIVNF